MFPLFLQIFSQLLQRQIEELNTRLKELHRTLVDMTTTTAATQRDVKYGASNVSDAEASLARSREALDEAERLLRTDGARALNDSIVAANATGQYAERMQEIKEQVPYMTHYMEAYFVLHTAVLFMAGMMYKMSKSAILQQRRPVLSSDWLPTVISKT